VAAAGVWGGGGGGWEGGDDGPFKGVEVEAVDVVVDCLSVQAQLLKRGEFGEEGKDEMGGGLRGWVYLRRCIDRIRLRLECVMIGDIPKQ
jgi:hypothetical protein